jgi:hypothetical protein
LYVGKVGAIFSRLYLETFGKTLIGWSLCFVLEAYLDAELYLKRGIFSIVY